MFRASSASIVRSYLLYTRQLVARAERDGTPAETRFRLSLKRTSPFKSVGASVQSTAGSRGVRISLSNAGSTTFGGGVKVLATHSIRQFPLHFTSCASLCATRFRTNSTFRAGYVTASKHSQVGTLVPTWLCLEAVIKNLNETYQCRTYSR